MKLPNFGYHLARAEGRAIRFAYAATVATIARRHVKSQRDIPFDVCSYSGSAMFAEQIASIRSFLQHAGRPRRFTVYSDGSHSKREVQLLRSMDNCLDVAPVPELTVDTSETIAAYLERHPTGRQLRLMMALPVAGPVLYIDSDVLFLPGAAAINALFATTARALYLRDCQLSADERLFRTDAEREDPVNTGMIFFREKLDWTLGLERLDALDATPTFHTNQTLTHLVLHANNGAPLDPDKFVLRLDDQFLNRDVYASPQIVARHYVNPVRHKFWSAVLRS